MGFTQLVQVDVSLALDCQSVGLSVHYANAAERLVAGGAHVFEANFLGTGYGYNYATQGL